jgi:anti-sigma factor (TIGR02949 family)
MKTVHFGETACERTRRYLDSYISNELLVETNHEVLRHLDNCSECSAELDQRTRLKQRVKAVVQQQAAPPDLQVRIREQVRHAQRDRFFSGSWLRPAAVAAACASLAVGVWQFRRDQPLPAVADRAAQKTYIERVSQTVAAVVRVGLGDHIHCAVFRKYPKNPPTVEQMEKTLGPQFAGLARIVSGKMPGSYRLIMAHQCGYNGRRFTHLTLVNGTNLVSLVIARKNPGESLRNLSPALPSTGIPVYHSAAERYEIASFETPQFLAFVVSDLSSRRNLQIAGALAPAVGDFLRHVTAAS